MRLVSVIFFCIIVINMNVFAELSSSSCSLLRTATSITTIIPEIAQIAMRYYRISSSSSSGQHHRQKRFLFGDNPSKDADAAAPKGSVFEQMVASAFKDVNFTRVALLILNNNETMAKIRQNVDSDAIIRAAMHEIDYEKLGNSLWYSAEAEFDLEYIMASIVNITHIDLIHDEIIANGTLPAWLIKSLHPDLNVQTTQQMFNSLKNFILKFGTIMNSSQNLEGYLFNIIEKHILTPLGKTIQRIKTENPTTLDHLVEIILDNINKVVMEQFSTTTTIKPTIPKKSSKNKLSTTTTVATSDVHDDVHLLLYQCSIAIESIGQTARILLKSFEQLYCASIWD